MPYPAVLHVKVIEVKAPPAVKLLGATGGVRFPPPPGGVDIPPETPTSLLLTFTISASDVDHPYSDLTFSCDIPNGNHTCQISNEGGGNADITITPQSNWNGTFNMTVHVGDPNFLTDSQSFNVTVTPVTDKPECSNFSFSFNDFWII